ncbi:hypothetical protein JJB07_14575 [Tumebacillus sp. ITR2]|uniref:DNA-binding protein n=1 Tax=Tumebacillus amylolyticus TaxID=2801339 RepID=A0ABS1JC69_9BACL|nr:hypothetical protein [Tumebacillus amylolyticus]MBL0387863.1 hypothetical protein [Tumebacillus amylolyticus]
MSTNIINRWQKTSEAVLDRVMEGLKNNEDLTKLAVFMSATAEMFREAHLPPMVYMASIEEIAEIHGCNPAHMHEIANHGDFPLVHTGSKKVNLAAYAEWTMKRRYIKEDLKKIKEDKERQRRSNRSA